MKIHYSSTHFLSDGSFRNFIGFSNQEGGFELEFLKQRNPFDIMNTDNIFENLPEDSSNEVFETIIQSGQVKIERIISRGHASRPDDWYDQDLDEWVVLLKGRARLQFADSGRLVELSEGDHIHLPAHCRHRVDWTDPAHETIWLAVFFKHVR